MNRKLSYRLLVFTALLVVCFALWILVRAKRTEVEVGVVASRDTDVVVTQRGDASEESSVTVGRNEGAAGSASSWQKELRAISPSDVAARGQRQVRRVTAFFVQQRLEQIGMSIQEAGPLRELLARRYTFEPDFRTRMQAEGIPTDGEEFERRRLQEKADLDAEIQRLVGPDRIREVIADSHALGVRLYAVEMAGEAALQGFPLSSSQRTELNDALGRIDSSGLRARPTDPVDPKLGANLYDMSVFVALEGILSKKQLQILQDIRYEDHLYSEAERLIESRRHGLNEEE